ncbi:hypothetical protein, partial [Acinetobacter baumannii]|uniref:hypothetical protein n=1 Tax=Acinetobacter baumannii TaxID=470 RepID=UPI0013D338BC
SDTRGEEIQRDDEAALFPADEDAEAFVRRRAAEGSERHQQAIQRHDDALAELAAEDGSNG